MEFETILFDVDAGVATITLNRPEKLNAVNAQMLDEISAALNVVESDASVRALLLTGSGRGFCPGQDLSARNMSGVERPDLGETLTKGYNPVVSRIYRLPIPTVCAVNGTAAGAGANLALSCDIVIAAESAKFIELFSNIGLIPDAGGTWILPRLVGMARAKAMSMLALPVKAAEAAEIGLIWKSVGDDSLMEEATALAKSLAERPTLGFALTKKAFAASGANSIDEQLALEAELQRQGGFSDDYREGVSAFMEKRKPTFKGS